MSKVVVSMTIDSVLIEKFKEKVKADGATVSGVVSKLIDEHLNFSKEKKEKEREEREIILKKMEEEKKEEKEEWDKMTPEQRVRQEHSNRCADLAYKGHRITDAMFRGEEALPEDNNFIPKVTDTSEFS